MDTTRLCTHPEAVARLLGESPAGADGLRTLHTASNSILNHTKRGELVYDPFLGIGSCGDWVAHVSGWSSRMNYSKRGMP